MGAWWQEWGGIQEGRKENGSVLWWTNENWWRKGMIRRAGLSLYHKTKGTVGWWSSSSCENVLWNYQNSALVPATKGVVSQRTVLHQGLTISTSGNVVSCSGLEIGTRMERVEVEGGGTAKRKQGSSIKGVVCNRQEQWHPAMQQKTIICRSTNQLFCSVLLLPGGQAVSLFI